MLLDAQEVYPQHLIPKVLRDASEWYIAFSGDPLVRGAFNKDPEFDWLRAFLYLEVYAKQSIAIVTKANNPRSQVLPTPSVYPRRESVIRRPTKVAGLLPDHARLLRFVVHHNIRLSRHPLDIPRPNSVPDVTLTRKLRPVLLSAVWNGDRHDAAPDEGPGDESTQSGVTYARGNLDQRWDVMYG